MTKVIKTLTLIATGLVVGAVVGRVSMNGTYKTITIDPNPTIVEIKNNKVFVSQVLLGEKVVATAHRIDR